MIYDVGPGQLVEHELLHENELDEARAKLAAGEKLEDVARQLGATVVKRDEPEPTQQIAVDLDRLVELVGEEQARELAGI